MKKITFLFTLFFTFLFSFSPLSAKRTTFVSYDFNTATPEDVAKGWTFSASAGEPVFDMGYMLFQVAGADECSITTPEFGEHSFDLAKFDSIQIKMAFGGVATALRAEIIKEDGSSVVLEKQITINDAEVLQSFGLKGEDLKSGVLEGTAKQVKFVLVNAAPDDVLGIQEVFAISRWIYPEFSNSVEKLDLFSRDFDEGGREVAYHSSHKDLATTYRKNEYVKLTDVGGGFGVCVEIEHPAWNAPGDVSPEEFFNHWYNYTIDVKEEFRGDITLYYGAHDHDVFQFTWRKIANSKDSWVDYYVWKFAGSARLELDGKAISFNEAEPAFADTVRFIETSGDWGPRASIRLAKDVVIPAGKHTIKLHVLAGKIFAQRLAFKNANFVASSVETVKDDKNLFRIYPNPAVDVLNIDSDENTEYSVMDMMGREVLRGIGNRVDVAKLSSGAYIVRINGRSQHFLKK